MIATGRHPSDMMSPVYLLRLIVFLADRLATTGTDDAGVVLRVINTDSKEDNMMLFGVLIEMMNSLLMSYMSVGSKSNAMHMF